MAVEPITAATLRTLLAPHEPPCVSVYMPTDRVADRNQNAVRFKNLLRQAEEKLRQKYSTRDATALIERFRQWADTDAAWNRPREGLACLAAGDTFRAFQLVRPVPEMAVVADSFHLKPILRHVQSADRFQVLGFSRTEAMLFEGDRYGLARVDTAGVIPTHDEAAGADLTAGQTAANVPADRDDASGHFSPVASRKDGRGVDAEKFLRAVDRAVLEHFSRASKLPLVLVALPQNLAEFRAVSQNPQVVPGGVETDFGALNLEQLRAKAWEVMLPLYQARLAKLSDDFRTAQARQLGTSDLGEAARAAVAARIGTILVDADRVIPGAIDRTTGDVRPADGSDPEGDDALDDLAEMVLAVGGEVVVVPHDQRPPEPGLAALYRV